MKHRKNQTQKRVISTDFCGNVYPPVTAAAAAPAAVNLTAFRLSNLKPKSGFWGLGLSEAAAALPQSKRSERKQKHNRSAFRICFPQKFGRKLCGNCVSLCLFLVVVWDGRY
jgi:hypothetical protein